MLDHIFTTIFVSMLGTTATSWSIFFKKPRIALVLPILLFSSTCILIEIIRQHFQLEWSNFDINELSELMLLGSAILTLGFSTYIQYKWLKIALVGLLLLASSMAILASTLGILGTALAFSRTKLMAESKLSENSRVICTRSGNALDAFMITSVAKLEKVPLTPFERRIWTKKFNTHDIFYGKMGFRNTPQNKITFCVNLGERYNIPACKFEQYRSKNKSCKRLEEVELTMAIE